MRVYLFPKKKVKSLLGCPESTFQHPLRWQGFSREIVAPSYSLLYDNSGIKIYQRGFRGDSSLLSSSYASIEFICSDILHEICQSRHTGQEQTAHILQIITVLYSIKEWGEGGGGGGGYYALVLLEIQSDFFDISRDSRRIQLLGQ